MEILKLYPAGQDYLWGGTRLRGEYGKNISMTPLAETWECSVHPDGLSIVANGDFQGRTLAEALRAHPEFLGSKIADGRLPVLIKFIDAKEKLSVQVHPDDAYAKAHEHQNGKTEMWYVLDAEEGAELIYGFQHQVTPDILRRAIATGTLAKHFQRVRVHKGDVYYVPAGMVHGIGAGILLAEIQESSNVTYRVYDYGRTDKNGKKRELHFEKAIEVMDMQPAPDVRQKSRVIHYYPGYARELLCHCQYFETERLIISRRMEFPVLGTSFQVLLCVSGAGRIAADGMQEPLEFQKGDCLFIPAGAGSCCIVGRAELLKVRC